MSNPNETVSEQIVKSAPQNLSNENVLLRQQLSEAQDAFLRQREAWIDQRDLRFGLEGEREQLRRQLAARDTEIEALRREIEHMRGTRIWQIGILYWRAHARTLAALRHCANGFRKQSG